MKRMVIGGILIASQGIQMLMGYQSTNSVMAILIGIALFIFGYQAYKKSKDKERTI
jgi:uncharacterized membrane protein YadS